MKILQLQFSNLNSLKGSWQIDFSHRDFEGIFAITGDTGAGKTTILDAICLAIYGKTPRVSVSANQNEIMHKNSYDCQSQVIIALQNKHYLFSFAQRRANKKTDGKLQNVERSISQLIDGQWHILTKHKTDVERTTPKLLHMNFEQFTRSVMLAQGKFAQFLSENKERGVLLERITGTEIYSQIGKKIYEHNKQLQEQLNHLKKQNDAIFVLEEADRKTLYEDIKGIGDEIVNINKKVIAQKNALDMAIDLARLTQEKQQHYNNYLNFQQQWVDFKDEDVRLTLAKKAQKITPIFDNYNKEQQITQELSEQIKHLTCTIKQKEQQYNHLKQVQITIDEQVILSQNKRLQQEPILALLKNINEINAQIDQKSASKQEQLEQLTQHNEIINQNKQTLQQIQIIKNEINPLLVTKSNYEGFANAFKDFFEKIKKHNDAIEEIYTLTIQINREETEKEEIIKKQNEILKIIIENTPDNIFFDIKNINKSTNLLQNYYQDSIIKINGIKNNLNNLLSEQKNFDENNEQIKQLNNENEYLLKIINNIKNELIDKKNIYEKTLKNYELNKEIFLLKKQIQSLKNGTPCPVCGSLVHPKKAMPEDLDISEDDVSQAYNNYIMLDKKLFDLNLKYQNTNDKINYLNKQCDDNKKNISDLYNQIKEEISFYDDITKITINDLQYKIDDILSMHKKSQQIIYQKINNYNDIDNKINNIDNVISQNKIRINDKKIELQQKKIITLEYNNIIKNFLVQFGEINFFEILHKSQEIWGNTYINLPYNINTPKKFNDSINGIIFADFDFKDNEIFDTDKLREIQIYNYSILKNMEDINDYNKQVLLIINEKSKQCQTIINDDKTYIIKKKINDIDQKINELTLQKSTLKNNGGDFLIKLKNQLYQQNISAYDYEKSLIKSERKLINQKSEIDINFNKIKNELEYHSRSLLKYKNDLNSSKKLLESYGLKWQKALSDGGFLGNDYANSLLSDEQIKILEEKRSDIIESLNLHKSLYEKSLSAIDDLIAKNSNIEDIDIESTQQTLTQLTKLTNQYHQKLGELNTIKDNDDKARQNKNNAARKYEQLQKSLSIWADLNTLIGDSAGKKYRNFVQKLTLESLLSLANVRLSKMNERYELVASDASDEDLSIEIIDHYQGGRRRSCANLSGGELFIISLALALGLSMMSSNKMQIDSLFLDEGFGALDEKSLNIALDTLTQLQENGKTIGIISHVESLKQRIDNKIIITKKSGGISEICQNSDAITQLTILK